MPTAPSPAYYLTTPSPSRPAPAAPPAFQYSTLARRHPSQILTRPLTPLLTLAAYGSLIISAFSALIALILASYGLSAWDDAKHKLIGVRALIGKGLDVGKEIVGAVTSTAFHQPLEPNGSSRATTMPRRAPDHADRPAPTSAASDRSSACSPKQSRPTTGYDVPSMDDDEQPEAEHHPTRSGRSADWSKKRYNNTPPPPPPPPPQSRLPPRPPLSVLIASLFLTLIVLSARLMVVWWMGQQAQKNPTNAFRNAQRAYNQAAHQEQQQRQHHHPHSTFSSPPLQRPSILRKSSSYAAHPYSSPTR